MNQQNKLIKETYKTQSIVNTFDKERKQYFYMRYKHKLESNFLIKTLNLFDKPLRVLDVACGTGRMVNEVFKSKNKIDYYGVDTSGEMMSKIKRNVNLKVADTSREMMKNIKKEVNLFIADASHLPFKDNTFDVVYTYHLLWHLPVDTQKEILKEMLRVTKEEGYILFDFLNKNFLFEKIKPLFKSKTKGIYKLSKYEVEQIVKSDNLKIERLFDIPIFNTFLYLPFHLLNLFRFLPLNLYHMCFVRVKKEDTFNV